MLLHGALRRKRVLKGVVRIDYGVAAVFAYLFFLFAVFAYLFFLYA